MVGFPLKHAWCGALARTRDVPTATEIASSADELALLEAAPSSPTRNKKLGQKLNLVIRFQHKRETSVTTAEAQPYKSPLSNPIG